MSPDDGAALFVATGATLAPWAADPAALTLQPGAGVTLPAAVQYVWFHPRLPLLYAAYSNRAARGGDDTHGVAAFRIGANGALSPFGAPVALGNRPIHVTLDPDGRLLLLTCNGPAEVILFRLEEDGAIGPAVPQAPGLPLADYPHQARFLPGGQQVVLCCRGSDAAAGRPAEPGALLVFDVADGVLAPRRSVTEGDGLAFGPRHLALHPRQPWFYVALERGNRLLACAPDAAAPFAAAETLAEGAAGRQPEQYAGAVHVHPDGGHVYVVNRSDGTVPFRGRPVHGGGENSIARFGIDPLSGVPTLRDTVDTHGIHCRCFAIHPAGRMLVAGSVAPLAVREGEEARVVTAGLSVFAVAADGALRFARKYDIPPEAGAVFWCGFAQPPGG